MQSQKQVLVHDLVNFVPVVAYLLCLNLPTAFSQLRKKDFLGSVSYFPMIGYPLTKVYKG